MNEIGRMVHLLDNLFQGPQAWHGTPVLEILDGIDASAALERRWADRHTIAELVGHMTVWRNIVAEALESGRYDNVIPREVNFPALSGGTRQEWEQTVEELKASQQRLRSAVEGFPEERLDERPPGARYTYSVLVHGLMQHDTYHAGQIALLKKREAQRDGAGHDWPS